MAAQDKAGICRRQEGDNVWISRAAGTPVATPELSHPLNYELLDSEEKVGHAMLEEIQTAARNNTGDLTILLLGGRGAQAMHRRLGQMAKSGEADSLLRRLHVFTQDALAPMSNNNAFSFVRDFERLLGPDFFAKVKTFTSMRTDAEDLEGELIRYVEALESRGGADIFFLGLGPEAGAASHLAYIKPDSGARAGDLAGVIPVSTRILEHHIAKFKAGGASFSDLDEEECRQATHILTLGPAAILGARRIVQSIVDADTAPAKCASFRRLVDTELAADPETRARQMDENPGLWIRLHPNARTLILPNVLAAH